MNEPTNQNTMPHQPTEGANSVEAADSVSQINTEQARAQTATLARETVLPLTQNIETMTSDIRSVVREAREQTRQARVANASLKIIAFGTTMLSLAILIGVIYLLKDIFALVVVSFLMAYIISPVVELTERKGINRTLVVIAITLLMLSGFAVLSTVTVNSITGQIWKFSEVQLTVELGHEDALDSGEIPEALRQKFLEKGVTLSQNTVIAVEEAGNSWKLTDTGNRRAYNIRKEENQLNVNKTFAYLVDLERLVDTATTALNLIPRPFRIPVLTYLGITEGVETSGTMVDRDSVQTIDRDQVNALVGRLQDQILGLSLDNRSQSLTQLALLQRVPSQYLPPVSLSYF